ncbi:MAG: toll/interleukin-1 receptor domain-containing protein [Geothrix sp.]|nr:toll/interleukin-1 receptor domain-containing protein [Geothrix sp.]
MSIPKVFISYSHDSTDHKKWVLDLATHLRASGVDAVVDQWDLKPGDDLAHFMETHLASADRVLMVCTKTYVEKANKGIGGVGYEKMIVTADLLSRIDSNKVIPIIRQTVTKEVPSFLRSKLYLDFSISDQYEFSFDELIRTLHNAPLYEKPPVSHSPFPSTPAPPKAQSDGVMELMKHVTMMFESTSNQLLSYKSLVARMPISRIMLDLILASCVKNGLIVIISPDYFRLSEKGKLYAIENKLIK